MPPRFVAPVFPTWRSGYGIQMAGSDCSWTFSVVGTLVSYTLMFCMCVTYFMFLFLCVFVVHLCVCVFVCVCVCVMCGVDNNTLGIVLFLLAF